MKCALMDDDIRHTLGPIDTKWGKFASLKPLE